MERDQLISILRNEMFSERETLSQAFQYADNVIQALQPENRLPVYTLLFLMTNTIANEIKKMTICEHEWEENTDAQNKEVHTFICKKCGVFKEELVK